MKLFEQTRLMIDGYADAGVRDCDANSVKTGFVVCCDSDPALFGEFHGIAGEVQHNLPNTGSVGRDGWQQLFDGFTFEGYRFLADLHGE